MGRCMAPQRLRQWDENAVLRQCSETLLKTKFKKGWGGVEDIDLCGIHGWHAPVSR